MRALNASAERFMCLSASQFRKVITGQAIKRPMTHETTSPAINPPVRGQSNPLAGALS